MVTVLLFPAMSKPFALAFNFNLTHFFCLLLLCTWSLQFSLKSWYYFFTKWYVIAFDNTAVLALTAINFSLFTSWNIRLPLLRKAKLNSILVHSDAGLHFFQVRFLCSENLIYPDIHVLYMQCTAALTTLCVTKQCSQDIFPCVLISYQCPEEDICARDGGSNKRLEKTA